MERMVLKQKCPVCESTFETSKPTKLWDWCPKCFKEARKKNERFLPVKLVEVVGAGKQKKGGMQRV